MIIFYPTFCRCRFKKIRIGYYEFLNSRPAQTTVFSGFKIRKGAHVMIKIDSDNRDIPAKELALLTAIFKRNQCEVYSVYTQKRRVIVSEDPGENRWVRWVASVCLAGPLLIGLGLQFWTKPLYDRQAELTQALSVIRPKYTAYINRQTQIKARHAQLGSFIQACQSLPLSSTFLDITPDTAQFIGLVDGARFSGFKAAFFPIQEAYDVEFQSRKMSQGVYLCQLDFLRTALSF